jgi:hypothetical protein
MQWINVVSHTHDMPVYHQCFPSIPVSPNSDFKERRKGIKLAANIYLVAIWQANH